MRRFLLSVLFSFLFVADFFAQSQDSIKPNYRNVFSELGGNGGLYSLNYENKLCRFKNSRLNWNAGFSVVPLSTRAVVDFPVSVNWLIGNKRNKFEIGTGQVLVLSLGGGKGGTIRGTFRFGYRYENEKKRYYFLFAYTPFYSYIQNLQYENWGGISFGYYFKK
jgi:hypothetical protein